MRELSTETQDTLAEANSTAEEVISSVATTRAFAAERGEIKRYGDGLQKYLGTVVRQAQLYFCYSSLTFTFLPYLTYCLILLFAAQLIHTPEGCVNHQTAACPASSSIPPLMPPLPPNGPPPPHWPGGAPPACGITGANLVSFVFYMQSLFSAFQSLGSIYTALAQAVGAADKVLKWIRRTPVIVPPKQPLRPAVCRGDLKLVDVRFRYALRPEKLILRDLQMHAPPGAVVALCGPSGGGKSSIIALLEGFYVPEGGKVPCPRPPVLSPRLVTLRTREGAFAQCVACQCAAFPKPLPATHACTPPRARQVMLDDIPIGELDSKWYHQRVALVGQGERISSPSPSSRLPCACARG